jgi:Api92-like protein with ferredoxin domain
MKSGGINDLAILCATKPENDLGRYAEYPWVMKTGVTSQTDLCQWHGTTRPEMVERGQQVLDNFERYAGSGYSDMCTALWGTKWNAIDPVLLSSDFSKAKIAFFTAWGPPLSVIKVLAQRFPVHNFKLRYVGECNEFRGVLEIKQGVITADSFRNRMG